MIVVDIGCHPQGPEESVQKLIDRFKPDVLFGFDPYPALEEGVECVGETLVVRRRAAAWTYDGTVILKVDGICTGVAGQDDVGDLEEVESISLPGFLRALPLDAENVVLKLDAEGAEYPLLAAIAREELDRRLGLILVEWHVGEYAHGLESDQPNLRCPVEAWE